MRECGVSGLSYGLLVQIITHCSCELLISSAEFEISNSHFVLQVKLVEDKQSAIITSRCNICVIKFANACLFRQVQKQKMLYAH